MWVSVFYSFVVFSTILPIHLTRTSPTGGSVAYLQPMVYLKTGGGLGNQLFQYACSYSLAKKHGIPLYIHLPEDIIAANKSIRAHQGSLNKKHYDPRDRTFALQLFSNIRLNYSTEVDNFILHHENSVVFLKDRDILKGNYPVDRILSIDDYCQSEKYFTPYQNDIRHLFTLNVTTDGVKKWDEIIHSTEQSVAVHIRKGDFDSNIHRRIGKEYYFKAMRSLAKKLKNEDGNSSPTFFIFSDDINAVKADFSKLTKSNDIPQSDEESELTWVTLDGNVYPLYWVSSTESPLSNIEEFYLMTRCRHNIISTSSFGWWTAYLNPNPDKIVIAAKHNPLMYIGDPYHDEQYMNWYYPSNWTVLDVKYDWS